MPRTRSNEEVQCTYYRWLLGRRGRVYYADGRGNRPDLGRCSLGTANRKDALDALRELDLRMAIRNGKAPKAMLQNNGVQQLDLDEGRRLYETYVGRPAVSGGPRATTQKRYRAVLDKFLSFARNGGVHSWNGVTRDLLDAYAGWLDGESYAYATEYLELNTIKQVLKFLVESGNLPAACAFRYPLRKPDGTDTYCWRREEVEAIIAHCNAIELQWLQQIVIALATTGLRIGELATLRWSDIDFEHKKITLTDESTLRNKPAQSRRRTKTGHSRSLPIHERLMNVLTAMERSSDGLVFHGPLGGRVKADTLRRILVRDVLTPLEGRFPSSRDEVGFKDGRLHSFRHYFCSTCANSGTPERVLMQWLGHRSSRMVRRYYHLHDDESRRQMDQIEII
ncbi:site-specific integrase [Maioricimonas sp. JC845]|uniref:tyrosine-type recombinase/integrase n=1 Tax=Maioricimonas sp. JC845 TaxID=3232138 RepID=UPI003459247C